MCGYLRKGKGGVGESVMFRTPSSIVVAGPSGCGKTYFVSRLFEEPGHYFQAGPPPALHYCYGAWQPGFEPLKKRGIHFHEGFPQTVDLDTWYPPEGGLLILDDLMEEGGNDKRVLDLFTKHSHHRHITVLYLCQDLFPPGKYAKTISRNALYVVAFKNSRDQLGIRNLMMQAFPTYWRDALRVYEEVTQPSYGYLMLDLHPASDDRYRLFADLLKGQGWTRTFTRCPQDGHARTSVG